MSPMSIINCLLVTFLRVTKLYLKPYFYVKPNKRKYRELFTSTNDATLIKLSKFVEIIMEKFSVLIVFPSDWNKLMFQSIWRLMIYSLQLKVNFLSWNIFPKQ